MNTDFIITTTNNIEYGTIQKYINTVCSNVVVGTNIFSDFAASITDFFGGRSASYQKKLETIYKEASEELKRKACRLGANAIIGFKVDFDEISGKDKSMFMVSASGTACVVEYKECPQESGQKSEGIIEQSELDKEILRRFIIKSIESGNGLEEQWVEFLCGNPQKDIINTLIKNYVIISTGTYQNENSIKQLRYIERIFLNYSRETIIPSIYSKYLEEGCGCIKKLITNCNLFDAKSVLDVLKNNISLGISLLNTKRDYYTKEEIRIMEDILKFLDNLPDLGKIETVKSGMFGKEQSKYICPNGHKNDSDETYCTNSTCGLNIKGLTKKQVEKIEQFRENVEALKFLFNRH